MAQESILCIYYIHNYKNLPQIFEDSVADLIANLSSK